VAALTKAFRVQTDKKGFCAIGSVKTNVGHLDAAAGIAGLIKTAMALQQRKLPPSLHFKNANPRIDFENSPFYVNTKLSDWNPQPYPRRAGVSALGVGGTNAHIVMEETPGGERPGNSRSWQLLLLSAKTDTALDKATANLAQHLRENPQQNLADAAYTLQVGRKSFNHRRMIVCQDREGAIAALSTQDSKSVRTGLLEPKDRDVVFMFSGQGSQYVNMGLDLYGFESEFRKVVDFCSDALLPRLSLDLRDVLYPDEKNSEIAAHKLKQTFVTQPALFVIEYALAKLWMSWGISPKASAGHSIGEYVAACLAGVFSLEDALSLVADRGRLMQDLPCGAMMAVPLAEREVRARLGEELSLAVVNGPALCVVSGETGAVENMKNELAKEGVECRLLHTSHAFHSKMMEPILGEFTARVGKVVMKPPAIPFVSNLTGEWIDPNDATNPGYWAKHLRHTVRFSDCVKRLLSEPNRVLLEVGPGQTLSTLSKQHPNKTKDHIVLSSIRHPLEQKSDLAFILDTIGQLWLSGVQISWQGFYSDESRCRVALPPYPFERKAYWISAGKPVFGAPHAASHLSKEPEKTTLSSQAQPLETTGKKIEGAPVQGVEQSVANIWQELLGIEQVGAKENFFELGGHSLLATQVIAKLQAAFGVKISLSAFFEAPTVAELTAIIQKSKKNGDNRPNAQREKDDLEDALRKLGIS